jgi:hypothetical protein
MLENKISSLEEFKKEREIILSNLEYGIADKGIFMNYLINRADSVTLKIVASARKKPMIKSLYESLGVE